MINTTTKYWIPSTAQASRQFNDFYNWSMFKTYVNPAHLYSMDCVLIRNRSQPTALTINPRCRQQSIQGNPFLTPHSHRSLLRPTNFVPGSQTNTDTSTSQLALETSTTPQVNYRLPILLCSSPPWTTHFSHTNRIARTSPT
ncbi:hypothetical protein BCR44DRAFT_1425229 [Catenaria anguillulae PL171]|uniref:Uncharacterized protein n=1 Tax=Catenaria anguillulae PL171 TaxID=765915 RepID=A0A1Y2I3G8_9FUNG|nr:hypothetical protein BCR44DRAFT_1425229 [Catenaria anguillulae PL171]